MSYLFEKARSFSANKAFFLSDVGLQTHNSMERLTASSSTMETKLSDMTRDLDHHHDLSERQLQSIDARLGTMQEMLARSISTNQRSDPKSRTSLAIRTKVGKRRCSNRMFQRAEALNSSKTQASNLRPAAQLLRVVSPALLIYQKDGLLQRELVPLVCSELNCIDDAIKIQVIKYLQGLRLLIWLLKHNNSLMTDVSELHITSRSSFSMQAAMIHSWEYSTAFQDLIYVLRSDDGDEAPDFILLRLLQYIVSYRSATNGTGKKQWLSLEGSHPARDENLL